jgi:hypothetical protein
LISFREKSYQFENRRNKMTVTNDSNPLSRADIEAELRMRAHKDKDFRHQLLTDSHTTLQQHYPQWFLNGKIPEEISIKVIEEDQQTLFIVLPQQQDDQITEVDEMDLGNIVGAGLLQDIKLVSRLKGVEPTPNTRSGCGVTRGCKTFFCN